MEQKDKKVRLAEAAEKLGVDLILLFGSRADESNRPDSDFDIAYRSEKPIESFGDIFRPLADYIGSDDLHIVDIRNVEPFFFYRIMNNCKVLYIKDMVEFYDLQSYAFRIFEDEVKPLFKIKIDRLKREYLSK